MWVFSVGQKKLLKELISLEDYCRSYNKQPFRPKLGEACCAQFSGETIVYPSISLASVKHSFHFCFRQRKNTSLKVLMDLSVVLLVNWPFIYPPQYLKIPGKLHSFLFSG